MGITTTYFIAQNDRTQVAQNYQNAINLCKICTCHLTKIVITCKLTYWWIFNNLFIPKE
jgi:hypothetical protein